MAARWAGSAGRDECTLHQLAPYIGKTKSSIASALVREFSRPGSLVWDPFAGSGTFALEAWRAGCNVAASDLSPYAVLLTRGKLHPYPTLAKALFDLGEMRGRATAALRTGISGHAPPWVREFFHPRTLRELAAWVRVLAEGRRWFLLSCLMGILHHQRPGFLSFPSSHTVPYLRTARFPREEFPGLYRYRSVADRLEAKVRRSLRRLPNLDRSLRRRCDLSAAERLPPRAGRVDCIVTSPPYMRQLDYGRDNRLRLWFLGCSDWRGLDADVSPGERDFLLMMRRCLTRWRGALAPGAPCVLVIGDRCSRAGRGRDLPGSVAEIAAAAGYNMASRYTDAIPNERRVRRGIAGSTSETTLVLRNGSPCS